MLVSSLREQYFA